MPMLIASLLKLVRQEVSYLTEDLKNDVPPPNVEKLNFNFSVDCRMTTCVFPTHHVFMVLLGSVVRNYFAPCKKATYLTELAETFL